MKMKIPEKIIMAINRLKDKTNKVFSPFSPYLGGGKWFAAFIAAFCIASTVELIIQKGAFTAITFVANVDLLRFAMICLIVTPVLWALSVIIKQGALITYTLLSGALALSLCMAFCMHDLYLSIGVIVVMLIIVRWLMTGDKLQLSQINFGHKATFVYCVILFVLSTAILGYCTIMRHYSYATSTYDFGIFTQMFENMRTTGLPTTTLERNRELSHFAVHFSPIYYLILPGYMIFQSPEYLLVAQSAVIAAGLFPLLGICRRTGLSGKVTAAILSIYALMPAMSYAQFYDFHENAFLPLMILCTCYFMVREKTLPMFGFSLLTLCVKEDAAIFILAISLYMIVGKKKYLKGGLMLLMAGVYFVAVTTAMSAFGEGIMSGRLDNYYPPEANKSFATVIKTCLTGISYFISQVFTQDRIIFIIYMLAPVLFAPLLNKKISTLFLLVPMLVINLMPSWPYQYDIGYQYAFGPAALIIFAAVLSIKEMKPQTRRMVLMVSLCVSMIFAAQLTANKCVNYTKTAKGGAAVCNATTECIESIPDDASVTATTFFTPRLYRHKIVFMAPYTSEENYRTEYVLMDTRTNAEEAAKIEQYMGNDYTMIGTGGYCKVYKITDAARERLINEGRLV